MPGYGYARVSPQEKEMLQKLIVWYFTTNAFRPFKVVVVIDSKVGLTPFDKEMLEILHDERHSFVIAANKIDKLSNKEVKEQLALIQKESDNADVVPVSAEKKTGTKELLQKVFKDLK